MGDKPFPGFDRIWYHSFCTETEIDRILNPQTAKDELLRKRADIVADHTRYYRVYRAKSQSDGYKSFEGSFDSAHYKNVLSRLSKDDTERCAEITYGDIFTDEVNGYASKDSKWGIFINLNTSLKFFTEFSNLALLFPDSVVPQYIKFNSLRIALRTMMNNESLDFYLDPRGIIPADIAKSVFTPIKYELQYIAGHEFSHFLCGHLKNEKTAQKAVLTLNGKSYLEPVYNVLQKHEFEADVQSVKRPLYAKNEKRNLVFGAILWFKSLELSEFAQEICCPQSPLAIKSHPSAVERLNYIRENFPKEYRAFTKPIRQIDENLKILKDFLSEDLSVNYDNYKVYGSAYLDKPNTKWRGKKLVDRVDY